MNSTPAPADWPPPPGPVRTFSGFTADAPPDDAGDFMRAVWSTETEGAVPVVVLPIGVHTDATVRAASEKMGGLVPAAVRRAIARWVLGALTSTAYRGR